MNANGNYGSTQQTTNRWIQSKREENRNFQTGTNLAGLSHKSKWSKANKIQNRSDNKTGGSEERQRIKVLLGLDTTLAQIHKQSLQEDRPNEEIAAKRNPLGMGTGNKGRFRVPEGRSNGSTVPGPL